MYFVCFWPLGAGFWQKKNKTPTHRNTWIDLTTAAAKKVVQSHPVTWMPQLMAIITYKDRTKTQDNLSFCVIVYLAL